MKEVMCIEVVINTVLYVSNDILLGLTWRKPFSNQKTKLLVTFKILCNFGECSVQELKKVLLRKMKEAQIAVNRKKTRERSLSEFSVVSFRYFYITSCHNNAVFVGFSLICLESLGFLWWYASKKNNTLSKKLKKIQG